VKILDEPWYTGSIRRGEDGKHNSGIGARSMRKGQMSI